MGEVPSWKTGYFFLGLGDKGERGGESGRKSFWAPGAVGQGQGAQKA